MDMDEEDRDNLGVDTDSPRDRVVFDHQPRMMYGQGDWIQRII